MSMPQRMTLDGNTNIWRFLSRRTGILLLMAVLLLGLFTYMEVFRDESSVDSPYILALLIADIVVALMFIAVMAVRMIGMMERRRRGQGATSRLQTRLVGSFSLIAVAPAILVAVLSALLFNFGVDAWFSERVRNVVTNSVRVANLYVEEHARVIRGDLLAMAKDIDNVAATFNSNRPQFLEFFRAQAGIRSLPEAYIMSSSGQVLVRARLTDDYIYDPLPLDRLEQAERGGPVIFANEQTSEVRAVVKLRGFIDGYLYVSRPLAPETIEHLRSTRAAAERYSQFEAQITGFQITFATVFVLVATLILLAAILVGMWLARRLARPIGSLVEAADTVSAGNLDVQVDVTSREDDEITRLIHAFNRMTDQLHTQRAELVKANSNLETRSSFIETVLSGVSAGVIGLDFEGRINAINSAAEQLLGLQGNLEGKALNELVPELKELPMSMLDIKEGHLRPRRVSVSRGNNPVELMVRISVDEQVGGLIVTLDDVTALLQAQRLAAWSDVARRVAHEIRNPLTPIQLATERMKRRFRPQEDGKDQQVFDRCTETIIRQVDDIRRMVDEFSTFARMPKPVLKEDSLTEVVEQAIFLQQVANPDIEFDLNLPKEAIMVPLDGRLISQAVINVVKNAIEALRGQDEDGGEQRTDVMKISLFTDITEDKVSIVVRDNGAGFPEELMARLKEPYVTTRKKGTGLGLAIVDRIMKDHGGELELFNAPGGGACVSMSFLRKPVDKGAEHE